MADLITDEMLDLFAVSGRFEEIGAKIRPSLDDPRWPAVLAAFGSA
jgi:hypothetical protein